jgi:hypothetical protein
MIVFMNDVPAGVVPRRRINPPEQERVAAASRARRNSRKRKDWKLCGWQIFAVSSVQQTDAC